MSGKRHKSSPTFFAVSQILPYDCIQFPTHCEYACGRRGRDSEGNFAMSRTIRLAVFAAGAVLAAPVAVSMAHAQSSMMAPNTVSVGGMAMYPSKTIVANAVNSQ